MSKRMILKISVLATMAGGTLSSAIYHTASWAMQVPRVYWEMGQAEMMQPMTEMAMEKGESYEPR